MDAMLVVGTRPEAIKLAPVYHAFRRSGEHRVRVCSTAQHRQMLDQVLPLFDMRPEVDLDLMRPDQTLGDFAAQCIAGLTTILSEDPPDVVLVQGDTTTACMAALAAFYLRIPVAHVEAGLRTGDRTQPFPEEMNRHLCDILADFLFVPTESGRENLLSEGYPEGRIHVTGNTVVDALQFMTSRVSGLTAPPGISPQLARDISSWTAGSRLLLVTGHRRESFESGIREIALALRDLSALYPDVSIIYPVHPNPNVRGPVHEVLSDAKRVHMVEPLPYDAFIWLMLRCCFILSDSGGIQEEAPTLGKPVLVLRDKTERPEAVEAGVARLVGAYRDRIVAEARMLLDNEDEYRKMAHASNPFGDGHASERIVAILEKGLAV